MVDMIGGCCSSSKSNFSACLLGDRTDGEKSSAVIKLGGRGPSSNCG